MLGGGCGFGNPIHFCGTHPAAKNNRVVPGLAQQVGELFQMAGPVGEDQAVAVLAECGEDVRGDLPGALLNGRGVLFAILTTGPLGRGGLLHRVHGLHPALVPGARRGPSRSTGK
jgi:hypothetical protein